MKVSIDSLPQSDHNYLTEQLRIISGKSHTLTEIKCSTCHALLASVIFVMGESADLVWPNRVECLKESHVLYPAKRGDSLNWKATMRGFDADPMRKYKRKYWFQAETSNVTKP